MKTVKIDISSFVCRNKNCNNQSTLKVVLHHHILPKSLSKGKTISVNSSNNLRCISITSEKVSKNSSFSEIKYAKILNDLLDKNIQIATNLLKEEEHYRTLTELKSSSRSSRSQNNMILNSCKKQIRSPSLNVNSRRSNCLSLTQPTDNYYTFSKHGNFQINLDNSDINNKFKTYDPNIVTPDKKSLKIEESKRIYKSNLILHPEFKFPKNEFNTGEKPKKHARYYNNELHHLFEKNKNLSNKINLRIRCKRECPIIKNKLPENFVHNIQLFRRPFSPKSIQSNFFKIKNTRLTKSVKNVFNLQINNNLFKIQNVLKINQKGKSNVIQVKNIHDKGKDSIKISKYCREISSTGKPKFKIIPNHEVKKAINTNKNKSTVKNLILTNNIRQEEAPKKNIFYKSFNSPDITIKQDSLIKIERFNYKKSNAI